MLIRSIAAAALLAAPLALHAQAVMVDVSNPGSTIAITGAKLLTVSHGIIENGTLVLSAGKIAAIGPAGTKIPASAQVVDAHGMTVYPGLFDSETQLGLTEVESNQVNSDLVETSEEIFPQMQVADAFHAETERIPIGRYNGITNAIVAPTQRDTLPGRDAFIQLAGRDAGQMILNHDIALALNFGEAPKRGGRGEGGPAPSGPPKFPITRMGEIAQLHQALIDATEYMRNRAKTAATKFDLRNEALLPYLKGEKPVVIGVYEGHDVEAIMALATEYHLKVVLDHVTHAQGVLDKIASYHVPVIVGPMYDLPEAGERYDAVYSLPAELARRGVKVAIASASLEFNRNLPYAAGYAVAYGLPYEQALRSITLTPAEIFGVGDQLGSLDVGKTANVVIANGDPLDVRTSVKQVYIQGIAIPMVTRQTRLRDEYTPPAK